RAWPKRRRSRPPRGGARPDCRRRCSPRLFARTFCRVTCGLLSGCLRGDERARYRGRTDVTLRYAICQIRYKELTALSVLLFLMAAPNASNTARDQGMKLAGRA